MYMDNYVHEIVDIRRKLCHDLKEIFVKRLMLVKSRWEIRIGLYAYSFICKDSPMYMHRGVHGSAVNAKLTIPVLSI